MATKELMVNVKLSWWVSPYLNTLILSAKWFGVKPDIDRVRSVISRGIIVQVAP